MSDPDSTEIEDLEEGGNPRRALLKAAAATAVGAAVFAEPMIRAVPAYAQFTSGDPGVSAIITWSSNADSWMNTALFSGTSMNVMFEVLGTGDPDNGVGTVALTPLGCELSFVGFTTQAYTPPAGNMMAMGFPPTAMINILSQSNMGLTFTITDTAAANPSAGMIGINFVVRC